MVKKEFKRLAKPAQRGFKPVEKKTYRDNESKAVRKKLWR